ncbi:MAG: hypothetical protein IKT98_03835 [Selenomonadaceae bacterium]|nr:hypothetical protein [Selenomonadaceae bacterium]
MKIYKCDVCGKVISDNDADAICGAYSKYTGYFGGLTQGKDVCGACARVGAKVDFEAAMLKAWRDAINARKELESNGHEADI